MEKIPGKSEGYSESIKATSPTREEWESIRDKEISAANYSVDWRNERREKGVKENADWIPNNHTEQSAEKIKVFYGRLLEIAKTFNATCEIITGQKTAFRGEPSKDTLYLHG